MLRSKSARVIDAFAVFAMIVSVATITRSAHTVMSIIRPTGAPSSAADDRVDVLDTADVETPTTAFVRGTNHAKVVLIEFSDFQCPFCARHVRETLPRLEREYIDGGRVDYIFRSFPLLGHEFAFKAAEALECAGAQERYWPMHDRLFAAQNRLSGPMLVNHAQALGLNSRLFEDCLSGAAESRVKADQAEGSRLGVSVTPTFFLGLRQPSGSVRLLRKIEGAQPFDMFKNAIDLALRRAVGA